MSSSLSNVQARISMGQSGSEDGQGSEMRLFDCWFDSHLTSWFHVTSDYPNYELWDQSSSGWMPLLLLKWKESMNLLVSQNTDPFDRPIYHQSLLALSYIWESQPVASKQTVRYVHYQLVQITKFDAIIRYSAVAYGWYATVVIDVYTVPLMKYWTAHESLETSIPFKYYFRPALASLFCLFSTHLRIPRAHHVDYI